MSLLRNWIRNFPTAQQNAVIAAVESGSLPSIRRALRLFDDLDANLRGPNVAIELLSTFTLEPMLPALQLALNCLPSRAQLCLGPLNDIEVYIARQTGHDLTARVVLWRIEEVLPEALYPLSYGFPDRLEEGVNRLRQRVQSVVGLHRRHARGTPLFISTLPFPPYFSNPIFAAQHRVGLLSSVARINYEIRQITADQEGVYVLDFSYWAACEGGSRFDAMLDFVARQPFNAQGQISLAVFIARSLRQLLVPRRKALAVDLDNTLWGGLVGEDGIDKLQLGQDFPGNVYLRIQRELLELRNRGILLILLSKNNEADARQAFELLPDMVLKWEDFAVRKVNWNPKHENLQTAASELGLGLDSFVFVDDSDYEREQMRQLLPEVLVLNETSDPLQTLRALWQTDAFDSLQISSEDRRRNQDYAMRQARTPESHRDDIEGFLRSLEMEATIEKASEANLERIVTMLGKTNQFNLTTLRHSHMHVQSIVEQSGSISLALRLRDKFGDQGIVAVLIAVSGNGASTLFIDSFLVSCRALGRGVEDALWAALLRRAHQRGIKRLEAEYVRTQKNAIVADLYDRFGLQRMDQQELATRYFLAPITIRPAPDWIAMRDAS